MLKIARILAGHCWLWLIFFLISVALVLSAARILLPQLERYHNQVEAQVSQLLGQDVSIARFEVGWHGLGPRLYLQNVSVNSVDNEALLTFDDAYVDISLWSSIQFSELDFGAFTLRGLELKLLRQIDGSLALEGFELPASPAKAAAPSTTKSEPEALRWLWRQGQLALEDSRIQFRDMKTPEKVWHFDGVRALLRNVDDTLYLSGHLQLPETLGRELQFMLTALRRDKKMRHWPVDLYLNGEGLVFANLLNVLDVDIHADKGELDLQLWGKWRQSKFEDLRAELKLEDAFVTTKNKQSLELPYFAGQFAWQGDANQWTVDIDQLHLSPDDQDEPGSRVRLVYQQHGQRQKIEGGLSAINVQQVVSLIQLYPALAQDVSTALLALEPQGDISSVFFRFEREPDQPNDFFVQAVVENGGMNAWRQLPGFVGLDGVINLDSNSGVIDLNTHDAVFDSAGLFREPLPLNSLIGRVAWQRSEQGLRLDLRQLSAANDDVQADVESRFYFPLDKNTSPQVALSAQLERGNVAMLGRYLPVKVMSKKLVSWLDNSVLGGRLDNAQVSLHGPLRRFPFDQGGGRFEVRANVVDGLLNYLDAWPRLEQIEAELVFVGKGMSITGHRAKIFNSDIDQIQVGIKKLGSKSAVLNIEGRATGETEDVLRYLNESPFLFERYGEFLGGAEAQGQSVLTLDLDIPFGPDESVNVSGQVQLQNSALNLVKLGVDLDQINGVVAFDGQGLKADSVLARVMGQSAEVNIFSETEALGHGMVFEAEGLTQYDALAQRLGSIPIFPYLIGESRWRARLHIPAHLTQEQPASLRFESDLQGTAITLPDPLFKGPELARNFVVEGAFPPNGARWAFNYDGNRLTGLFSDDDHGFRGELHFAGEAVLPERKGIRVAGALASFSDEDWFPIIFPDDEGTATDLDAQGDGVEVNALTVSVVSAQLFSQQFDGLVLNANKEGSVWAARVDSEQLIGLIYVPEEWSLPLEATLDYLYLPKFTDEAVSAGEGGAGGGGERWFDPKILPPLRVNIKRFNYGGEDLGHVDLLTEKRMNGLSVEQLRIESDFASTVLKGAWTFQKGQHNSVLEADMQINDLGRLLTGLDFAKTVHKGKGNSQVALSWPAPIFALETERLDGSVVMAFKKGNILEVDPGAGRLFGLLSVQALPRRFLFDFRDLGEGLAFDEMGGRFEIKSGNAYSRDFMLDGPTAKVELEGRVGLAARDYDQRIFVTPHVSSGLPLIGAVTAGLGVGAAVLLVERLLKSSIDKATRVEYSITGSWDEPKVAPVQHEVDAGPEPLLPEILRDE